MSLLKRNPREDALCGNGNVLFSHTCLRAVHRSLRRRVKSRCIYILMHFYICISSAYDAFERPGNNINF